MKLIALLLAMPLNRCGSNFVGYYYRKETIPRLLNYQARQRPVAEMCRIREGGSYFNHHSLNLKVNSNKNMEVKSASMPSLTPFQVTISDSTIDDLRQRLSLTRWPSSETAPGWSHGVPLTLIKRIASYWAKDYDMTRLPTFLNSYDQFTTKIQNVDLHFIHVKSQRPNAIPLLLCHGWPGSVLEFRHVIDNLVSPANKDSPAFDLVIPSMPGYGFSSAPVTPGYDFKKTAEIFAELMQRLGYADLERGWIAQGGDWGADVVAYLGHRHFKGLRGVHMNSAFFDPRLEAKVDSESGLESTGDVEKAVKLADVWDRREDAYFKQQFTRPQTLGYGMSDSPVGLLAWLFEKCVVWAEPGAEDLEKRPKEWQGILNLDEVLDNVMLYWITNSVASSFRMYAESESDSTAFEIGEEVAVGVTLYSADLNWADKRWGERYYRRLVSWNTVQVGGHYAAWEQPQSFVEEVTGFVRKALAQ